MTDTTLMHPPFAGRVAIISGAARGIGASCARLLHARGAQVVLGDVNPEGSHTAAELGVGARFVRLDVTDQASWEACVAETVATFGAPSVLVNNAGIFRPTPLEDESSEQYVRHLSVNTIGPFLGIKAVLPAMKEGGGAIVNISSIAGTRGFTASAAYCASKWAVRGLTKSAAKDLGNFGIRVNCVLPGLIDTDMALNNSPETNKAYIESLPVGQIGQTADVANLVAYLASEEARFITGADFVVDGGQTI